MYLRNLRNWNKRKTWIRLLFDYSDSIFQFRDWIWSIAKVGREKSNPFCLTLIRGFIRTNRTKADKICLKKKKWRTCSFLKFANPWKLNRSIGKTRISGTIPILSEDEKGSFGGDFALVLHWQWNKQDNKRDLKVHWTNNQSGRWRLDNGLWTVFCFKIKCFLQKWKRFAKKPGASFLGTFALAELVFSLKYWNFRKLCGGGL